MKILHIGKYFPPYAGGMETYLRDLMAAQARQGLKVSALVHQADTGFKSSDEDYTAGELTLPVTRAAVWFRALFTPVSPTFPWLLNRLLREQQPDILHLHLPNVSAFWALLLPRARRLPWVLHWHADVLASAHSRGLRLFYAFYRPLERALLRRCAAVIATSAPYLESSQPLAGYRAKCEVIALGLDPSRLPSPDLDPPSPSTDAPLRVLAVGRLTYYKGFDHLLRAAGQNEKVEVHLVGSGEQETALKALARELELGSRVTFYGHLNDEQLAQQFRACDCLCLPSIERTEAFGMVLLEAMYHGRATVISRVAGSGMGWVVEDDFTGLHVAPENALNLAQCLRTLQQNRDKIRALGEQGRARFDQLFHIDKSAACVSELYQRVMDNTTAASNRPLHDNKHR